MMTTSLHQWQGRTALIVDDSISMRLEAQRILEDIGFGTILLAEDGRQALDVMAEHTIDFLLTDLNMPVMDGVELLAEVEKRNAFRLYVAVMSGLDASLLSSVREIAENSEFELIGVLPKPIDLHVTRQMLAPHDPERHRPTLQRREAVQCSENEVASAIEHSEIVPFFQPKVRLRDGAIIGLEALARWQHPTRGLLMPATFITHLESGPLVKPHFFHQVTYILRHLPDLDAVLPGLSINVNMPVSLLVDHDLVEQLMALLNQHNASANRLVLEVTETSVMSNLKACLTTLARLRMKGFEISMDDYGTGYSSMKQLAKCPFTELKIDQSFVHNASSNPKLLSILNAALGICEQLRLTSVAEGIEDLADFHLLRAMGYEIGQGYHFSHPLPLDQLLTYLATHLE